MKKISVLQCGRDQHKIIERSVKLIKQYKSMMEKAQENGVVVGSADKTNEASSPVVESTSLVATSTTSTTSTTAMSISTAVPAGTMEAQVSVEGINCETRQVTTLETTDKVITNPAPAPEAVVAAVAAIVETNTLPSAPSSVPLESQMEIESSMPKEQWYKGVAPSL